MDLGSGMFRFNMVSGAILEGKIGAKLVQTSIEKLMDFLLGVLGCIFEGWGPKSLHFGSILEVLEVRMASF